MPCHVGTLVLSLVEERAGTRNFRVNNSSGITGSTAFMRTELEFTPEWTKQVYIVFKKQEVLRVNNVCGTTVTNTNI